MRKPLLGRGCECCANGWIFFVTGLAVISFCASAKAQGISVGGAEYAAQSLAIDTDIAAAVQNPTSYSYLGTYTSSGWAGYLTGNSLEFLYTGSISSYVTSGLVSWSESGLTGGVSYSENGTMQFTPIAGGSSFSFTTNLAYGSNVTGVFTMTGTVADDPGGGVDIAPADTNGSLGLETISPPLAFEKSPFNFQSTGLNTMLFYRGNPILTDYLTEPVDGTASGSVAAVVPEPGSLVAIPMVVMLLRRRR
jgi:hypothetical protein